MYPPASYGPAYGQPPPDPRSSPYGDPYAAHHVSAGAPPPPGPPASHDPYASHYDAYYRQQAGAGPPPPEQAPGYSQQAPNYPPPGSPQAPSGYPPPGYPPPEYPSYPHGHPPPPTDGSYPPPLDPHAAHFAAYGAPPPGYGAPPGYPPAYGAPPPPGYGFGYPPPGYGPPPPGYGPPPPGYPGRAPSPPRDRRIMDDKKRNGKGNNKSKKNDMAPGDARGKLQSWLQVHPAWYAVWVEGIDPPRRMASTPNVTTLFIGKYIMSKSGERQLAFIYSSSRTGAKKKDREKECATELMRCLDQLPIKDICAWYHLPPAGEKRDMLPDDLERVTKAVRARYAKATVEVPEPTAFVLVEAVSPGPHEKAHGADADLALLENFDPGFAELLREARRVNGLVRKQWYQSILWVKPEPGKDNQRPFPLGIGFATDRNLARARAVYSAEMRLPILSDAMFDKNVKEKQVPKKPVDESKISP
mmetsp:Transcript_71341/g.113058  ORF Transcript_71341/g.113058 Transcript_71341/m.113058 type:complete len:473 (-) Transcript_71341:165-1583(-)